MHLEIPPFCFRIAEPCKKETGDRKKKHWKNDITQKDILQLQKTIVK